MFNIGIRYTFEEESDDEDLSTTGERGVIFSGRRDSVSRNRGVEEKDDKEEPEEESIGFGLFFI